MIDSLMRTVPYYRILVYSNCDVPSTKKGQAPFPLFFFERDAVGPIRKKGDQRLLPQTETEFFVDPID